MAEQTGALYRFYESFEVGGLPAPNTAPDHVHAHGVAQTDVFANHTNHRDWVPIRK